MLAHTSLSAICAQANPREKTAAEPLWSSSPEWTYPLSPLSK
ncbi:hypothetical protein [Alienimonas californiensis]|nr:hypothetical protein [Alienimonas californiensis]